jgi:amidase
MEEFEAAGLPIDLSLLEPATRSSVLSGREVSAVELGRCYRYFTDLSKRMASFYESFDILVMPTLTKPPFKLGELSAKGEEDCLRVFHDTWDLIEPLNLANIGGHPAMSLPLGETEEGLPVGVELSAAFGREDLLLALAFQLEEATRWQRRQPLHHVSSVRSS